MRSPDTGKGSRMDESRIELYDDTGKKTSLKAFKTGDVVVARLGQKMSEREFREFIKRQGEVLRIFQSRGITLIFCPEWMEFREWRDL